MVSGKVTLTASPDTTSFTSFVERVGKQLHQALIAAYGLQTGEEVTSEALAYAWEHWDRVRVMQNPAGYLYRVGQSKTKRGIFRRPPRPEVERPALVSGWYEPQLADALAALSEKQRAAVLLVHGLEWKVAEVARLWGTGFSTVKEHVDKGMEALRRELGAEE